MSEFIGSRISLISKSDIRYVGTLHEINSEKSTVALENVSSFGTEGRKGSPAEEIAGSDSVYEYIVFRGSDVKDLRIEEPPKENKAPQPPTPNDPAILSGHRPQQPPGAPPSAQQNGARTQNFNQPPPFHQQQYNQFPNQPYGGAPGPYGFNGPPPPPPGRGFGGYSPYGPPGGPHGPPGPHGFGGPPPPPPGHGFAGQFPPPGPFSPSHGQMPFGAPGPQQHTRGPSHPQNQGRPTPPAQQAGADTTANGQNAPVQILKRPTPEAQNEQQKSKSAAPVPSQAPRPPNESKPAPSEAKAPPAPPSGPRNQANEAASVPKPNKIMPIMPLPSPMANKATPAAPPGMPPMPSKPAANAALQQQNANTQAATAAVAAAMAKLGAAPAQSAPQPKPMTGGGDVMDNLSRKVNEMRVDASSKSTVPVSNHTGGFRGRGRGRGGRGGPRGIEVPNTEFDFAGSNAQFNKEDVSKEATDGLNGEAAVDGASNDVVIPPAEKSYNAKSSFFDNISSDAKEREAAVEGGEARRGGREFRNDDRKRNLETFGIGSVDGGYRGGFRGRGGRGRGFRGGGGFRGRGRGSGQPIVG